MPTTDERVDKTALLQVCSEKDVPEQLLNPAEISTLNDESRLNFSAKNLLHRLLSWKKNIPLLANFAWRYAISGKTITKENARFMLDVAFHHSNDKQIIQLFLWLFGKRGCEHEIVVRGAFTDEIPLGDWFKSKDILNVLDVQYSRDVFMQFEIHNVHGLFQNVENVETVKVLTVLLSDLSEHNKEKWNYLHIFSFLGKATFFKPLLESGHDIDQRDSNGSTPLLCLSCEQPTNVTQYLIESGADVYAVNEKGQNFLHKLVFVIIK